LAGGVSANTRLRAALADAIDVPLRLPPLALCTDNAAMIAAAAFWTRTESAARSGLALDVEPGLAMAVL
jgi:N6-L-threonylcarbamoyladenine synthase